MENDISEPLKLKIFWGSMPPDPPLTPRAEPRAFGASFLCASCAYSAYLDGNNTLRPYIY